MAQRVEVVLVDDLDGGPAAETVSFALDGVSYEIDLNAEHAQQLRDAVAPFLGHARRVGGRRGSGRSTRSSTGTTDTAVIRSWAKEQGLAINERGRIPAGIVEQYQAAHA